MSIMSYFKPPKEDLSNMPAPRQALRFALNFFRHPYMLGAIVPSSRFLVDDVIAQVDWKKARVVVEYGPGVGTITQEALKRMRPDAMLIAIELDPDFCGFLKNAIRDPRFQVVQSSALAVREVFSQLGLTNAGATSSPGIPFSSMHASLQAQHRARSPAGSAPGRSAGGLSVHAGGPAVSGIQFHLGSKGVSTAEYSSRTHFLLHPVELLADQRSCALAAFEDSLERSPFPQFVFFSSEAHGCSLPAAYPWQPRALRSGKPASVCEFR